MGIAPQTGMMILFLNYSRLEISIDRQEELLTATVRKRRETCVCEYAFGGYESQGTNVLFEDACQNEPRVLIAGSLVRGTFGLYNFFAKPLLRSV